MIAVPTDLKGRSFKRVNDWSGDELLQPGCTLGMLMALVVR